MEEQTFNVSRDEFIQFGQTCNMAMIKKADGPFTIEELQKLQSISITPYELKLGREQ